MNRKVFFCDRPIEECSRGELIAAIHNAIDQIEKFQNQTGVWNCEYCGVANRLTDLSCRKCAAPRTLEVR